MVVTRDRELADDACSVLGAVRRVRVVDSIGAAQTWSTSQAGCCGVLVDGEVDRALVPAFVAELRARFPRAPVVVAMDAPDPTVMNHAFRAGAACVVKPLGVRDFGRFLTEACAADASVDPRIRRALGALTTSASLTPAETDVIVLLVAGFPQPEVEGRRGITRNTLKSQVRSALAKLGVPTIADLRWRLLEEGPELGRGSATGEGVGHVER